MMDGWIYVELYRGAALLWGAPQSVVQLQCKSKAGLWLALSQHTTAPCLVWLLKMKLNQH